MLRIENLTKIYGEHKAVDDLSLHIRSVYKELHADHETGAADNK